jgi:outer membrane lipoprotein-sorting protein
MKPANTRLAFFSMISLLALGAWALPPAAKSAAHPAEPSVMEVLKKFDEAQIGTKTLRARFHQEKISALLSEPDKTTGILYMQKPERILLHYQKPKPAYYYLQDANLLVYYPELKRAQQMNVGRRRSLKKFLEYFGMGKAYEKTDKYFDVSLQSDPAMPGAFVVKFLPARKRLEKHMEQATLWLDRGNYDVLKIEFIDEEGEIIRIALDSIERNVNLDGAFTLPIPADVRVEKISNVSEIGSL